MTLEFKSMIFCSSSLYKVTPITFPLLIDPKQEIMITITIYKHFFIAAIIQYDHQLNGYQIGFWQYVILDGTYVLGRFYILLFFHAASTFETTLFFSYHIMSFRFGLSVNKVYYLAIHFISPVYSTLSEN